MKTSIEIAREIAEALTVPEYRRDVPKHLWHAQDRQDVEVRAAVIEPRVRDLVEKSRDLLNASVDFALDAGDRVCAEMDSREFHEYKKSRERLKRAQDALRAALAQPKEESGT
mgnify:CR=1 FL=1